MGEHELHDILPGNQENIHVRQAKLWRGKRRKRERQGKRRTRKRSCNTETEFMVSGTMAVGYKLPLLWSSALLCAGALTKSVEDALHFTFYCILSTWEGDLAQGRCLTWKIK